MLPNFICVGFGRAGTSWLYEVLLEHPQVCMAKDIKETQFFNENYERGPAWYERFFKYCDCFPSVGEISNLYMDDPNVPYRIKSLIPDCKILVCLRNPYDRIQSVYSFKLREGALNCSFDQALKKMPELIYENCYFSLIKPYFDLFGKENVFLVFFDEIVNNPSKLCRELFRFLNVDDNFAPGVIGKRINQAIIPRFPMVPLVTKRVARLMRIVRLYKPLTWAKRSDRIKNFLFKEYNYKNQNLVTPVIRAMIDPVVLPELARLEQLAGRNLNSWKQ